jgi:lysophospholipase L1-like esterase
LVRLSGWGGRLTVMRRVSGLIAVLWALALVPGVVRAVPHDGDINIDGAVNTVDLLWAIQVLLGTRTLTSEQEQHGDVAPLVSGAPQPDGVFDLGDVVVITRLVLGELVLATPAPPANQFNIGDSIGEGEAANGTIGEPHHETVWSTGYDSGDIVNTLNERYETLAPADYYENNAARDPVFNQAVSGAVMADFAGQAQDVVAASSQTPSGTAGQVTMLLGNNDVCADTLADMTNPAQFEVQYRAGLDVLAASAATRQAQIHVSGIPAIYWLWNAKRGSWWCRLFVWPFVPCQNLLKNPDDDCANSASRNDPDHDYSGDGPNCQRRKQFHRIIRDTYNPILRDVLAEYRQSGALPNARYIDIYDVKFGSAQVNDGDCFHPSAAGHALLADTEWCRTALGAGDPQCAN